MTSKTSTTASQADRQAVLDVLKRGYKAWEANDAEAFVADYLDDASVVQPGIYRRTGKRSGHHGGWVRRPAQGLWVIDQPQDVRFLTEDTAIVISEGGIVFPGQDGGRSEGARCGYLGAVKRDGRWCSRRTTTAPPTSDRGTRRLPGSVGSRLVPGGWPDRVTVASGFGRNALSSWHSLDCLVDVRCPAK